MNGSEVQFDFMKSIDGYQLITLLILLQTNQQNILIIMTNTPKTCTIAKTQPNTTLKQAIHQQITHQQHLKTNKKIQMTSKTKQEISQMPQHQLKVLQTIELYESKTNPGYIDYEGWVNFNLCLFSYIKAQTITNFWKIMRLINYGEAMIPTGLIYQISIHFVTKNAIKQMDNSNLKNVINSFLNINLKNDYINNFRQLSNYPCLDTIEKQYCPCGRKSNIKEERSKNFINGTLHQKLFKEGRIRDQSLQKLKYASIVDQLKQCKFSPTINIYQPKTEQKRQRICQHEPKVEPQQFNHNFIARQIDKKIYKSKVEQVPGAQEHIKRALASQAERRRIQRYITKPWLKVR